MLELINLYYTIIYEKNNIRFEGCVEINNNIINDIYGPILYNNEIIGDIKCNIYKTSHKLENFIDSIKQELRNMGYVVE